MNYLLPCLIAGLASGAMFYNVILEVIHQEKLRKNVSGLLQFGSILFGFIITVLIKILSKYYIIAVKTLL